MAGEVSFGGAILAERSCCPAPIGCGGAAICPNGCTCCLGPPTHPLGATQQVEAYLRQLWGGFGQSKVVEDTCQKLRSAETEEQSNKKVSLTRAWWGPSRSGALATHGRDEVASSSDQSGIPAPSRAPRSLFYPPLNAKAAQASADKGVDLRKVKGKQTWPTFSPQSVRRVLAASSLLRHCWEHDCWEDGPNKWMCTLVPQGSIFKKDDSPDLLISWGHVWSTCLMAWRVVPVVVAGVTYYTLKAPSIDNPMDVFDFPVVLDYTAYKVIPCSLVSPLHMWLVAGTRKRSTLHGLAWKQTGGEEEVLKVCAEQGFMNIPQELLPAICDVVGVPSETGAPRELLVAALLAHFFPDKSAEDIAAIMKQFLASFVDDTAEAQELQDLSKGFNLDNDMGDEDGYIEKVAAKAKSTRLASKRCDAAASKVCAAKRRAPPEALPLPAPAEPAPPPPGGRAKAKAKGRLRHLLAPAGNTHQATTRPSASPTTSRLGSPKGPAFRRTLDGRFQLKFNSAHKSVSWTMRGVEAAARAAWDWLQEQEYVASGGSKQPYPFFE